MAGNLWEKLQRLWNPPDDEYDEYYEEETAPESEEAPYEPETPAPRRGGSSNRVVNFNSAKPQVRMAAFRPMSYGGNIGEIAHPRTGVAQRNIGEIADAINGKQTVILNLEQTEKEELRRILDFLGGVAYANDGKIKRVSTGTYIITPHNVDLSGEDVVEELENAVYY